MTADARDEEFRIQVLCADGPVISTDADTSDLIGNAWVENASLIAVPASRLDPDFFVLRTGRAGTMAQKLVNYELRLAVMGDISGALAASSALRAWVAESNRGEQIWFVADEDELHQRLGS